MCDGLDSDRFRERIQALRNALDDAGRAEALLTEWWRGIDDECRRSRGIFVTKLIEALKEPQDDWPGKQPSDVKRRPGLTQKRIAEMAGMSEAALTEAKSGAIADEKLNRLKIVATIRGVPLPRPFKVPSDIRDNVLGVIYAMRRLREFVPEETCIPLDRKAHECIRAAVKCELRRRARLDNCVETEEEELAARLLERAGVSDRNSQWLRNVFDEWIPALFIVLEELDAVFNS